MILEWNGSRRSKAATVLGARSVSSSPLKEKGPAVMLSMACNPLRATASAAAGRPAVRARPRSPRSRVFVTLARSRRPIQGEIWWRYWRSSAASVYSALQVDQREIGVRADLEPALGGEPEAPGGAGRREPGGGLQRQVALAQQQCQRRLAARDPAPGVGEAAGLEVGRGGGVVGGEHVHRAVLRRAARAARARRPGAPAARTWPRRRASRRRAGSATGSAGRSRRSRRRRGCAPRRRARCRARRTRGRCAARSRCPRRRRSRGRSPRPRRRSAATP